jgi:hypothetical protein
VGRRTSSRLCSNARSAPTDHGLLVDVADPLTEVDDGRRVHRCGVVEAQLVVVVEHEQHRDLQVARVAGADREVRAALARGARARQAHADALPALGDATMARIASV